MWISPSPLLPRSDPMSIFASLKNGDPPALRCKLPESRTLALNQPSEASGFSFSCEGSRVEEFIEERAKLVRLLADKADPFIKVRLIKLAERYERELRMRWPAVNGGKSPRITPLVAAGLER